MIEDVQVVRYQRADRERLFALLRDALPPADSARLLRQWDWKYERNPFNPEGAPHVLLLQRDGQLIGMYGRLFFRAVIGGTEHLLHHGSDLLVHPAFRGHGLSAQLRDRDLIESSMHFSWQNEASYRVARRDGTAGLPYRALVRALDVSTMVHDVVGDHWFADTASRVINSALPHIPPLRRHAVDRDIAITPVSSFDDRFDRLWQRCAGNHRVMIVRDRQYLAWRFGQRPDAEYRIAAAARGAELVGYVVTRCTERNGDRWGYLVDFLVEERSASVFAALVEHAVEDLRQQHAGLAICRIAVPPYRAMLWRHGFLPWRTAPKGYIRLRLPPHSDHERDWFVTMGDGDLEMSF